LSNIEWRPDGITTSSGRMRWNTGIKQQHYIEVIFFKRMQATQKLTQILWWLLWIVSKILSRPTTGATSTTVPV
jgi:hypothetical protein